MDLNFILSHDFLPYNRKLSDTLLIPFEIIYFSTIHF